MIIPCIDGAYQPAALGSKSVKFIATEIEKVAPKAKERCTNSLKKVCMQVTYIFSNSISITIVSITSAEKRPSEGFLLIGTNDAEKYLPEFEKEGYQFEEVYESLNEYSGK